MRFLIKILVESEDLINLRNASRRIKRSDDILRFPNEFWKLSFDGIVEIARKWASKEGVKKPDFASVSKALFDDLATQYENQLVEIPESNRSRLIMLLQVCFEVNKLNEKDIDSAELDQILASSYFHLIAGQLKKPLIVAGSNEKLTEDYLLKKAAQFARNPGQAKVYLWEMD